MDAGFAVDVGGRHGRNKIMPKTTVTFGEIMLRLAPPGFERFLQTPSSSPLSGAERPTSPSALAGFGLPAAYVTVLPPNNPIADAVHRRTAPLRRGHLEDRARQGPDGHLLSWRAGANQRPSKVVYDRDNTAIALAKPGDIDWDSVFEGAGWFHITGITPAHQRVGRRPRAGIGRRRRARRG